MQGQHPQEPDQESSDKPGREFHPWRLLGALGIVILLLGGAAALVDVLVLGW